MDMVLELVESFLKIEMVMIGGKIRNELMYNGFKEVLLGEIKVIVYDVVRLFIFRWVFEKIIDFLDEMDVVIIVNLIIGNLIELDNGKVKRIYDCLRYVMGEVFIGYCYDVLKKIFEMVLLWGILNEIFYDIFFVMEVGFNVYVLYCNCFNLKIIFREDVEIVRILIKVLEE